MNKDKLFQKLKNMKQYKDYSAEELEQVVQKKLIEEELLTAFIGLRNDELKKAIQLYEQYIAEHSFESLAEKSTLINVVRDEIIKERILKQMQTENETKNGANSLSLMEEIRELEDHILSQKEKLGMMKNAEEESALNLINELKEKALTYYETHAGETYVKCPECQNLVRFLMKVDGLDPAKATFFRGTTLYNEVVLKLYHEKKITLEDAAAIHGVNTKYITLIYENIYLKELNNKNDSQN
jgi:hypothetical protein